MKDRIYKQAIQDAVTMLIGKRRVEQLKFYRAHRYFPNLDDPKTFTEKVIWRKLNDRDPRLPSYVDKYAVKQIIESMFGSKMIIPTLAVYDRLEDVSLNWPMPFVVKCTHASATNIFIHSEKDKESVVPLLKTFLRYNHAKRHNEWAYEITPRIIIEPMVLVNGDIPNDFKFHVFDGKAIGIQVDTGRFSNHRRSFYSADWKVMDFSLSIGRKFVARSEPIPKPRAFDEMLHAAHEIGRAFSYARVDLYDGPFFGEVTFYPGGGFDSFSSVHWDRYFGDQWNLPEKNLVS